MKFRFLTLIVCIMTTLWMTGVSYAATLFSENFDARTPGTLAYPNATGIAASPSPGTLFTDLTGSNNPNWVNPTTACADGTTTCTPLTGDYFGVINNLATIHPGNTLLIVDNYKELYAKYSNTPSTVTGDISISWGAMWSGTYTNNGVPNPSGPRGSKMGMADTTGALPANILASSPFVVAFNPNTYQIVYYEKTVGQSGGIIYVPFATGVTFNGSTWNNFEVTLHVNSTYDLKINGVSIFTNKQFLNSNASFNSFLLLVDTGYIDVQEAYYLDDVSVKNLAPPNPVIALKAADEFSIAGRGSVFSYDLTVSNWAQYPDSLFGSGTCVNLYNADSGLITIADEFSSSLASWCTMTRAADLDTVVKLGFLNHGNVLPRTMPRAVYLELKDSLGNSYLSNVLVLDRDLDGVADRTDNCISKFNPDQSDQDNDGIGDVCDLCPQYPNSSLNGSDCPLPWGTAGTTPSVAGAVTTPLTNTAIPNGSVEVCVTWNDTNGGKVFPPDCNNVNFQLTDTAGNLLAPNCLYPEPYDISKAKEIGTFDPCVTCPLADRFPDLGTTVNAFKITDVNYSSYVRDPWYDPATTTGCLNNATGCTKVWTGEIPITPPTEIFSLSKTTPTITWNTPVPVIFGSPLTGVQLNATASVPGNFVYNPGLGTTLGVGTRMLSTAFTPENIIAYNSANMSVPLSVYYKFIGFQSPYYPPTVNDDHCGKPDHDHNVFSNSYKVGSTIPLKWQYANASGTVQNTAASNVQIQIARYADDDNVVVTLLDLGTAGSSGYQYDTKSKTWKYNWKTTGLAPGRYNVYVLNNTTGQTDGPFPIKLRKK